MKTVKLIFGFLFYVSCYAQTARIGIYNPSYNVNQMIIRINCGECDSTDIGDYFELNFSLENHDTSSIYYHSKTFQYTGDFFLGFDTLTFYHPTYVHDLYITDGEHFKVNQSWKFKHYLADFHFRGLELPYMQSVTSPNGYYQDSITYNWLFGGAYGPYTYFAIGKNMDSIFLDADYIGVEVDFVRYTPDGDCDSNAISINYEDTTGWFLPNYEEQYMYAIPEDSVLHVERLIQTDSFGAVHIGNSHTCNTYFDNVRLYPVYNQYICQGDSLEINGVYQFTEGVYIDSLFTALGTDSIIGINLKFNEVLYGDTIEAIACEGEGYMINDTTLISNSGVFSFLTTTPQGCDSIFYLDLEIQPNDIALDITNTDNVLSYNNPQSDYSYQWINASTGQPISGETNDTFIPTVNGLYAVEISNGVCTQVSNSSTTTLGIHDLGKQITCTPNPFTSSVNILFGEHMESGNIELYDINSRLLITHRFNHTVKITLDTEFLPAGVYVIKVKTSKGLYQKKVIK